MNAGVFVTTTISCQSPKKVTRPKTAGPIPRSHDERRARGRALETGRLAAVAGALIARSRLQQVAQVVCGAHELRSRLDLLVARARERDLDDLADLAGPRRHHDD